MSTLQPPADAVPVEINGQVVDPHDVYAQNAIHTNYLVVTFRKILCAAEKEVLRGLSVTILENLGNHNFLCHYPLGDLRPIREQDFTRQADVYRAKFKIPTTLAWWDLDIPMPSVILQLCLQYTSTTVNILTHKTVTNDEFEGLRDSIANTSDVSLQDMEIEPGRIRMTLTHDKLIKVAQDDRVRIIEEDLEPQLMNSDSIDCRPIVRGDFLDADSSFTGKGPIILSLW